MRVFMLLEHYPNPYKPYCEDQINCLLDDGHDVTVFAHGAYYRALSARYVERRLDERTERYPTTVRTLRPFARRLLLALVRQPLAPWRWLRVALRAGEPPKQAVMHVARLLLLPQDPPDVVIAHNLAPGVMYRLLPERYPGVPFVLYYHGGEVSLQRPIEEPARGFEAPTVVLAATQYVLEEAVGRGCDRAKLRISPLGYRIGDFLPTLPKQYRPEGILRLVSVGRVHEEKGIRFVIEGLRIAAERGLDRVHYTVIGNGPLVQPLRQLADSYGLGERVRFAGVLSREQVIEELTRADALVLASVPIPTWQENQACVMQEAMLMHLLVAASRTGGVQESIPPELHAFSFAPGDADGIARAIAALDGLSNEDFVRLGACGRRFVERDYDVTALTREVLAMGHPGRPALRGSRRDYAGAGAGEHA